MIASDHEVIVETFNGEYNLRDALEMLNQCVYRGTLTSWDKTALSNQILDKDCEGEIVCQFSTRFNKFSINGKELSCPEIQ